MHRDVMSLVEGGYGAEEIVDAFVGVYGERARMAPKPGFEYVAPFIATGGAAVIAAFWILRHLRGRQPEVAAIQAMPRGVNATSEELERIKRAIQDD